MCFKLYNLCSPGIELKSHKGHCTHERRATGQTTAKWGEFVELPHMQNKSDTLHGCVVGLGNMWEGLDWFCVVVLCVCVCGLWCCGGLSQLQT